ncbi:MAG: hypothetical protein ATN35_13475 [Epulopiscium sp. Nele67-Bin004]|nr:MAG: hypothetical protein ATN35_13475 [Epulopiscium sp. Nele67-Bin004]
MIIGFILKLDTLFTILTAGIITGLISGLNLNEILTILGTAFIDNRNITLFVTTLPLIGIIERYGVRQRATTLIYSAKNKTVGEILTLYMIIRQIAGALYIRTLGHMQFVRPLVNPLAQSSAETEFNKIDDETHEKIKALSATTENLSHFFGQNLFDGSSGVLLITSILILQGFDVNAVIISQASIIMALVALLIVVIQNILFDKSLSKKYDRGAKNE